MAFKNSIFGNNGQLTRDHIVSSNFVPGVSGWEIRRDGHAEFNDITIRSGTVISGTSLYYDPSPGSGNLVASISATSGTDPYGNAYLGGICIYDPDGSTIQLESGAGASEYFKPQNLGGTTWSPGLITTTLGASNRGGLDVSSPATAANPRKASFTLLGGGPTTNDTSMLVGVDTMNVSGDLAAGNIASGIAQTPTPGGAPGQTSVNVVFATAFTSAPRVILTPDSAAANLNTSNIRYAVTNRSTTGFTINCYRDTNAATNFCWYAHV